MKLHTKIMLLFIPFVLAEFGLMFTLGERNLERVWTSSITDALRLLVTSYREGNPERLHELLERTGFGEIESFQETYKQAAIDGLEQRSHLVDAHITVYDREAGKWFCDREGSIERISALWPEERDLLSGPPLTLNYNPLSREYYVFARFEPWNWVIVAAMPDKVLRASIEKQRNSTIYVGLGVFIAVVGALGVIIRRFVNAPIERMEDETRQILGPEDVAPTFVTTNDEFGRLARVIENVGKTVQSQRRSLLSSNDLLEARVREKTRELSDHNQELTREIARRTAVETELRQLVEDKEILVREVHHRVKNNLALISSLLRLHSETRGSEELKSEFRLIETRIETMARIHKQLYSATSLEKVDASKYLGELIGYLNGMLMQNKNSIETETILEPINMGHVGARICGLIVNELVTNSYLHGFPNGQAGTIRTELAYESPEEIRLSVSDNGVGATSDQVEHATGSLGMTIVRSLALQLHATIAIDTTGGFSVTIRFSEASVTND